MSNAVMQTAALILIDVQPDFCPGGPLACHEADKILKPLNALLKKNCFARYVATQDWHSPEHISFASSHEGQTPFNQIDLYGHQQTLWPDHCVAGTAGAALHPALEWDLMNTVIRKGTNPAIDSYSAFQENFGPNDSRPLTGLSGWLKDNQIKDVYVCGIARDVCVLWSAQDAASLGFNVHFLWDYTAPVTPESDENTKLVLEKAGVKIIYGEI